MNFQHGPRAQALIERLQRFMRDELEPAADTYRAELNSSPEARWRTPAAMQRLKARARDSGLWNLFLPDAQLGAGLTHLEYAPLAEIMGRLPWASEAFNCNAPDTGNMELLLQYATEEQKARWLRPLLDGEIRSCFAMTEPDVASSDPTNLRTMIRRDGNSYVIDGRKWFITGALNESCRIMILMGLSNPERPGRHERHSHVLIPMDTAGLRITRNMTTYGYDDAPFGHADIVLEGVRVPVANLILGEGRGFEIAQGRLGPGRIHHCMRLIGAAQHALDLSLRRVRSRIAFGKPLGEQGTVRETLARSAAEIEQARLLTLRAADTMDRLGNRAARDAIGMAKIVVQRMAERVIDRAIQLHGAAGFSEDLVLAELFAYARWCRMADGPDEVHLAALGKSLLAGATGPAR